MSLMTRLLFIVVLVTPGLANAGPPESPGSIAVSPTDPNLWAVRYDYVGGGLMFSEDGGTSWALKCNAAVDPSITRETIGLAMTPSGDVFTGVFTGLWRVGVGGCGADQVTDFEGLWVSDLANHPGDPNAIFAITSSGGKMNGVAIYDASEDTWTPSGTRESILISRIRAAANGDGVRLYEGISTGETMIEDPETGMTEYFANYEVRYSDDKGETWTSFPHFEMSEGTVRLEGVDPNDPNRILISESFGPDDDRPDRIWVNSQAGDPTANELVGEVESFGGAIFGRGGELWFADSDGPLYIRDADAESPRVVAENARAHCLTYNPHADTVLACLLWTVAEVAADGTVTTKMDLKTVDKWVSCDDGADVAGTCENRVGEAGWCGPSHFPESGVCASYCYPGLDPEAGGGSCEPMAPDTDTTSGDQQTPTISGDGDSGNDNDGGPVGTAGMPAATGDGDGDSDASESDSAETDDQPVPADDPPPPDDDSGCRVARPGSSRSHSSALFLAFGIGLLWRRASRTRVK